MAFRAFVALDVGPEPELLELHEDLGAEETALTRVDPQNYHVTLKFLGDISEGEVPGIVDAMHDAVDGVQTFPARLHGVGAFPSEDYIKVVWAGMEDADPLDGIAASLDGDLAHLHTDDHDFHAHVTLARMKGGKGKSWVQTFLDRHRDDDLGRVEVDRIRLKQSELTPQGPVYSTVEEVPLDG